MNYLYFCLVFLFCCLCVCLTFLFCARVLYVQKTEKLDPVNVIKPQKKITALKRINREEALERMLENG